MMMRTNTGYMVIQGYCYNYKKNYLEGNKILEIDYKNKKVMKQFSPDYAMRWKYPERVKEKLLAMEIFIRKAESLRDILNYRPYHFHQLQGIRQEEWSLYVGNTGYRVTVFPCDEDWKPIPAKEVIKLSLVIKKLMITEVSNHYE